MSGILMLDRTVVLHLRTNGAVYISCFLKRRKAAACTGKLLKLRYSSRNLHQTAICDLNIVIKEKNLSDSKKTADSLKTSLLGCGDLREDQSFRRYVMRGSVKANQSRMAYFRRGSIGVNE